MDGVGDLRPAHHLAPGGDLAGNEDAHKDLLGDALGHQVSIDRVLGADGGENRILDHLYPKGAFGFFFRRNGARDHPDLHRACQGVGHALACPAGRDIKLHAGVQLLVFLAPAHHQRVQRKSARNGDRALISR